MSKTKQMIIKVNDKIYNKLLEQKEKRKTSISNILTGLLVKSKPNDNYVLSDTNFCHILHIRLNEKDFNIIKAKFGNKHFYYWLNRILEQKLHCLSYAKQKRLKQKHERDYANLLKLIYELNGVITPAERLLNSASDLTTD